MDMGEQGGEEGGREDEEEEDDDDVCGGAEAAWLDGGGDDGGWEEANEDEDDYRYVPPSVGALPPSLPPSREFCVGSCKSFLTTFPPSLPPPSVRGEDPAGSGFDMGHGGRDGGRRTSYAPVSLEEGGLLADAFAEAPTSYEA